MAGCSRCGHATPVMRLVGQVISRQFIVVRRSWAGLAGSGPEACRRRAHCVLLNDRGRETHLACHRRSGGWVQLPLRFLDGTTCVAGGPGADRPLPRVLTSAMCSEAG
ncbi:hypothetical protein RHA1_ro08224 (plasmid) [Rhodococcus jostii RHA1]|uniref:Uncharacterized protein n=1 Tax=Rhodococcus jostii (strain RHA1) TaxID=101510 RepID=Q0RZL7_RHOJR|nr:hypothetical protein RHA1_ro08224 [Rhodococcus jostii RHA1]